MGDPAQEECAVRLEDGSSAGPLRGALRPPATGDLLRRKTLSTTRRRTRPTSDASGRHSQEIRLRVPAGRPLLRARGLRTAYGMATGDGERAAHEAGVCRRGAPARRGALPGCREDPPGMRQPLYSLTGGLLRDLLPRTSTAPEPQGRVCLYAGTRLVAEHGGGRDLRVGQTVSQGKTA